MRLTALFLRSRRAGYALAALGCVALLAWAAGWLVLYRPAATVEYLSPVVVFAALLAACVVGVGAGSPFGETEKAVAFPLPALRFVHLAGLLVCVAGAFLVVSLAWDRPVAAAMLVRGLLGLSGMAFLAALTLGGRLSWTLPVLFVAIIPFVGDGSGESRWAWWAWVDQPAGDPVSWLLAAVLLVCGLGLVCFTDAP